jgi:hypothetical protein
LEGHFVELMGETRYACTKLWPENLNGRDHLEDPGADGRTVLKCILK